MHTAEPSQLSFYDVSDDYQAFVDKFKQKKTSDDCYTPQIVYDAVVDWATARYGFAKEAIVRPFWPGGDYERYDYPDGCVVLDNPPFSILSKICRFYNARGIRYFLFGPALTIFSNKGDSNYIVCDATITYDNGAFVSTSFLTNMGEYMIESSPDLREAVLAADKINRRTIKKELPRYTYPPDVVTSCAIGYLAVHGTEFKVRREEALFIRKMDEQEGIGKAIFGGGFLLTEEKAAEFAAARATAQDRAREEKLKDDDRLGREFKLSPRERDMQAILSGRSVKFALN